MTIYNRCVYAHSTSPLKSDYVTFQMSYSISPHYSFFFFQHSTTFQSYLIFFIFYFIFFRKLMFSTFVLFSKNPNNRLLFCTAKRQQIKCTQ